MRFHKAGAGFGVALLCLPLSAIAEPQFVHGPWPGGNITVSLNVTSFTGTNLPGLNLTKTEARQIITSAMNVWKERTGASLNFISGGDTTTVPVSCTSLTSTNRWNGKNEIAVVNGCFPGQTPPNCTTMGAVHTKPGALVEQDLCIYGQAPVGSFFTAPWTVQAQGFQDGLLDLKGLLTHEFGHVLGFDHNPGTVMQDGSGGAQATMHMRYPWGDDFDGVRSATMYGVRSQSYYWKAMTTGSTAWGSENSTGLALDSHVNGTIGSSNAGGHKVIVGATDNGAVVYDRWPYPMTSTLEDSRFIPGSSSMRPPGIAGRADGNELWVGAWPLKRANWGSCPEIFLNISNDSFATYDNFSLGSPHCTVHDVAVAYDPISDRFILVYVRDSQTLTQNHVVFARTASSADINSCFGDCGHKWTSAQNLGFTTIDAPSLACGGLSNQCVLTYLTADTQKPPKHKSTTYTVDASTGLLTSVSWSTSSDTYFKTMSAGVRTRNGAMSWVLADNWIGATSMNAAMNGTYDADTLHKPSVPFVWSGSDWTEAGITSIHRPALASSAPRSDIFLLYVR